MIEDESNLRVLILGHSNGGQGTWYMASRFPDRVVAGAFFLDHLRRFVDARVWVAIPAAGYIKSQAYVPLTQSRYVRLTRAQSRLSHTS